MEALAEPGRPAPQLGRQSRQNLELSSGQNRAEAELRRRSGVARQEQRLGLLGSQAGESRSVTLHKLEAAVRAAVRVDGDP